MITNRVMFDPPILCDRNTVIEVTSCIGVSGVKLEDVKIKKFVCDVCKKECQSQIGLYNHKRIHK